MTLSVVDVFEVVDVDHREAEGVIGTGGVPDCALELEFPRSSVGQTGQRVGVGEVVQLGQQPVALKVLLADVGDQRLESRADQSGYGDEQDRGPPRAGWVIGSTADDQ